MSVVVAKYQYKDEQGNVLYEKHRIEPGENGKKKTFKAYRVAEDGSLQLGLAENTRRVLYHLEELADATEAIICEGEKDVETLRGFGLVATTKGGSTQPWIPEFTETLAGKQVIILPDQDAPGKKAGEAIYQELSGCCQACIVNVPKGKDVTEYFEHGGTIEELLALVEVARMPASDAVRKTADLLAKRGKPGAIASERLILGAMMNGSIGMDEVAVSIKASDFLQESHGKIFEAIGHLSERGESTDIQAVGQCLHDQQLLESIGGLAYLIDLTDDVPPAFVIDTHLDLVASKAQARGLLADLMTTADKLILGGSVDEARNALNAAADRSVVTSSKSSQVQPSIEIIGSIDEFFAKQTPGIMTNLSKLNSMTYGLREKQLWVIGARPSDGKTSLAAQICVWAAAKGHRTDIFSFEVGKHALLRQMICTLAQVDARRMMFEDPTQDERIRLQDVATKIASTPLYIDDGSDWVLSAIRNHVKQQHIQGNPIRVLMIDYLQLMGSEGRSQRDRRDLELGVITRGLKRIANDYNMTVILLSQLSREGEKINRKPQKSDLRDSGSIEADADVILLLWHEKSGLTEHSYSNPAEIIVAKQRNGPVGDIHCQFIRPYTFFVDNDSPLLKAAA